MNFSYPKANRLRHRSQFLQLARSSLRHTGKWMIIEQRSNGLGLTRLGVTATKRFGKAHLRNRFKRIVREAFRLSHSELPVGIDINVRPLSSAHEASSTDIYEELLRIFLS